MASLNALGKRVIVAGLGRLGLRIVEGLARSGADVRVITSPLAPPSRQRLAEAAGATLLHADFRDEVAWLESGVTEADAVIICGSEDSANLEAALLVKRLAPQVHVVTRVECGHLAHRIHRNFGLSAALCPAALCTRFFVEAALAAPVESKVPLRSRPKVVSHRRYRSLWIAAYIFVVLFLVAIAVFHFGKKLSVLEAAYFSITILTTVGFGDHSLLHDPPVVKLFGMLLMLSGVSMIALMVSIFSQFILSGEASRRQLERQAWRQKNHVIIAGLGTLGLAIARDLHGRGIPTVLVEKDPVVAESVAWQLHLIVVLGDAKSADTLLHAGIDRARALLAVTSSDATNLEIGLMAATLAEQHRHQTPLPITLVCQDPVLAERLRTSRENFHTLSTSDLAAPVYVESALRETPKVEPHREAVLA